MRAGRRLHVSPFTRGRGDAESGRGVVALLVVVVVVLLLVAEVLEVVRTSPPPCLLCPFGPTL